MTQEQSTLIYIEEKDKQEANASAKFFADKDLQNRIYTNVLGAELAGKYLNSEGFAISPVDNMHNIKKVLEEIDISDIILPRTHIDVRMIFDEKYIFVPKSHFDLNILPDIYFVFQMAQDVSHVKFLGFFEPSAIDKTKENAAYYFITKDKLTPVDQLGNYLESAESFTKTELTETDLLNFEESIIDFVDNDITDLDKKILLKVLTKSPELRAKFIEFENFELISHYAANEYELEDDDSEVKPEKTQADNTEDNYSVVDFDDFSEFKTYYNDFDVFPNTENSQNLSQTEDVISPEMYDDIDGEVSPDENEQN